MKQIVTFLLALSTGIFTYLHAQENNYHCGYHKFIERLSATNPQAFSDYKQFAQQVRNYAETDPVSHKTTYIIPVVFHIVHEYGSENISDLQVLDQLQILNRDFRKLNLDISQLVAGYDTLAADVNIEFRLPTIGPNGECTNGIEHVYSHETSIGDDYSKINQWPRSKYLNIWVFRSFVAQGIAGFSTPPTLADTLFYTDGIAMLHSYLGSIGTGNTNVSRFLVHEIGHFLGLIHPWGNGDPGIACGDDGIADTPETKGFTYCSTIANAAICDPSVVENYENFMEMSFCQKMFTHDQAEFMRNVLNVPNAERNNLVTAENLAETGVFANPAPVCTPVADFVSSFNSGGLLNKFFCAGDEVRFRDVSWNAGVTNRTWYFEDGTPSTSSAVDPAVTFTGSGWKMVKLIVSNANGADSITNLHAVYISQSTADKNGPYSEDFETGNLLSWLVDNPEENHARWQLSDTGGKDNSRCMKLNNYKDVSGAPALSEDYFYNFRLGGSKDILISPSNDLTNTTGSELIFDYAYATNAANIEQTTELLKIYVSKNCGKVWVLRKTLSTSELITATNTSAEFIPSANTQWKTCTVPISIQSSDTRTRFKFEFIASDSSNNLFLDNIRITGALGMKENPLNVMDLSVYPNPAHTSESIAIHYTANEYPVNFELMDLHGKILSTETNDAINMEVTHQMNLAHPLAPGCYYIRISAGEFSMTKKIVVI